MYWLGLAGGVGVVVGWNSGLEMCRRSSSTVHLGGGVCMEDVLPQKLAVA